MRTARPWRWLTANVIDLRKGAAVTTAGAVTLLVVAGLQRGLPPDSTGWLLLVLAVALAPLAWVALRSFLRNQEDRGPDLPSWDPHPDFVEPSSNVRSLPPEE